MLFKISKGLAENLPAQIKPGNCWYTTDENRFYIDTDQGRKCINDIPESLADLLDDASHRTVTDTQIAQWSQAQPNQNAFSSVVVGNTTLSADSTTDSLTLVAGANVTLTPKADSDSVTITAKDTTYTLTQDSKDGHKFTLTPSSGSPTTITIPDNNTTYALSVSGNNLVFTPSSGSGTTITVPYATNAGTVNNHTVEADVPENAKFTDTVYEHPTSGVTAGTYRSVTVNANGHVTAGSNPTTLSGYGITDALSSSLKGANNGLAELDSSGKVPATQLPSYVDDVLEYTSKSAFPAAGETGKIYVDQATNLTYRWSGSAYVEISPSLALGETSSTAYRGDRGKIAYDHSQATHARTDATKTESSSTNGNIKINGTETTVYTHPGSGTNPHGTTKSDVGLGNVGNFKAVSTVASQGLTDTEKSNARANIGAGTSSLTLGTSSSTAYRGDYGNTAYTHSQSAHARTDATKTEASSTNGNIKIDGTETTVYTHPGSGTNPHGTTKSDVGLGNVGNFKAVSTVASQGLSATEQSNARANIGAGTSSFSGSYGDLSNKPTIPTKVSQLTNDSGYTTTSNRTYYGTCTTAAATKDKAVTISSDQNFKLEVGVVVYVKFTYTNSYSATSDNKITLNVNSTGAKNIYYANGYPTGTNTTAYGIANYYVNYMYNGTDWVWIGYSNDANTTYSVMSASEGTTGTATSARTMSAANLKAIIDARGYTTNTGTITGITMNGASKGTSGVVNLGTVITAHQDISGKADKSSTVSTVAWDSTNSKLTKTINGTTSDIVTGASILDGLTKSQVTTALGYTPPTTDTNTHYISKNVVGETTATSNTTTALTNGNVYLNSVENGAVTSSHKISGSGSTTVTTDESGNIVINSTDTQRSVSDAVNSTSSTVAASSKAVKTAYDLAASKTSNTGTVTKVSTGIGLTGGDITTTGTVKAKLKTETARTIDSLSADTSTTKLYPVVADKSGYLAVGVPWTDSDHITSATTSGSGNAVTAISADANGALTVTKGTTFLTSHQDISGKANLASPAFSGTPTAPTAANGTNNTQIATTAFVMNAFTANDAMVFKGTIGSSGATVTALPATHYQGWTYKVITAGTYAGAACEIGDMIICITDGTSANDAHWTVVQSNIDGAVTGPASSVDARVAVFNGTSGKVIKDSGFTIAKSVPSNAVFTDTDTKVTAVGNHYTPIGSSTISASGGTATNATGSGSAQQVVTGVTVDAKGHVTAVTSKGIYSTDTDTNTHRPIQVNGTEVLGNNTTALNLKAGSNVSITDGGSGAITIAATDTKYTAATAAPGNIATSGSQGSSTNYARQDHTHGISLATGDSNGQVKIAGSNVSVKGLGSAAYTNSTAYAVNNTLTSENLNTVLAPGFYNAGGGNSITNKPSGIDYFGLEVIHNASGDYYTQIINNGSTFYRRNCINGTWSAWTQDKYTDTNTWRPVSDSVSSTSSSDAASSKAVKTAYDLAASKTANTGTVTSIATGAGLTGGTITGSGTIKAKLKSETASTLDSETMGSTTNRQYAVGIDKSGYLSVNVPWSDTNTNTTYTLTQDSSDGHKITLTPSSGTATTITIPDNNTNNAVTQTATTTNSNYEVLFSATADNTTRTEGARKNNNLTFNPSTGNLTVTQLNGVTVGNSPKFTDNNTWTAFAGASANAAGTAGYVPAPGAGNQGKYFRGDGTWATPTDTNTTYSAGTGLSLSGTTFNHSNSITAQTTQAIYPIKIDAQGHISAYGSAVNPITSHQTIKQDGVTGATVNRFGTCSTAASTAAKVVSITTGTFTLEAGSTVAVKFTYANTANSPTLNVNSSGAKNIFVNGAQITSGGNKALLAGTIVFIYDGTQWNLIGNYYDTNTQTVTGVKGNSESSYRTGKVNITAANIGLGNVGNFKAVSTVASQGLTSTEQSNARANIGAGTSSLALGSTASTAAAGNHTHTLSIATSSGTNQITLKSGTKYQITAGGSTYVFTTPSDTTVDSFEECTSADIDEVFE